MTPNYIDWLAWLTSTFVIGGLGSFLSWRLRHLEMSGIPVFSLGLILGILLSAWINLPREEYTE